MALMFVVTDFRVWTVYGGKEGNAAVSQCIS